MTPLSLCCVAFLQGASRSWQPQPSIATFSSWSCMLPRYNTLKCRARHEEFEQSFTTFSEILLWMCMATHNYVCHPAAFCYAMACCDCQNINLCTCPF